MPVPSEVVGAAKKKGDELSLAERSFFSRNNDNQFVHELKVRQFSESN